MLRLRRGFGQSARLARLYQPSSPSPLRHQYARHRTFATESDTNEEQNSESNPNPKPKRPKKVETEAPKKGDPDVAIRNLKKTIRRLRKVIDGKQKETKESDNFDETLDVVRKVYGVEQSDKRTKSKKKDLKAAEETRASTSSPGPMAQAMGAWMSMREILQQKPTRRSEPPLSRFPEEPSYSEELPLPGKSLRRASKSQEKPPRAKANASKANGKPRLPSSKSIDVQELDPASLKFEAVEVDKSLDVPKLAHNLDRVLFNSGVHELQDPRSRVFNFDPSLASIMPANEFDFDAIAEYVTSSEDHKLRDLCRNHGKKYCGSTSSMTALLSQFHYLISGWRKPGFPNLSKSFPIVSDDFTIFTRSPAAAFANFKDGVYAIDADKQFASSNILAMLGKSMEKLLTLPKEEFEKYHRTRSHELSDEEKNAEEGFHYTTIGDFMLRSQLDAHDPRLPGTGMFDLKTRAVLPIRMDVEDYEKGVGYEIRSRTGEWQSYEREYYDMVRSAFLKYSLQVRIGRMDGIFVAFHNTQRIFGFQYISLNEMDEALHGTSNTWLGDSEFKASVHILNDLLNRAAKRFPGQSLRLHVETRPGLTPLTYFFAEPVDDNFIRETQATGQKSVEDIQKKLLGLVQQESQAATSQAGEKMVESEREPASVEESPQDDGGQNAWDEMMAKVDEVVEGDSRGLQTVRDSIHQALEQSGLLLGRSDVSRESYLDALVEALATELPGLKDANEATEELPSDEQDKVEKPSERVGQDVSEATTTPAPEKTEDNDTTRIEDNDPTRLDDNDPTRIDDNDPTRIEDKYDTQTEVSVEESPIPNRDVVFEPSLKDLIMKVAQNVENKEKTLGVFEQVLSELVAEANKEEAEQEAQMAAATEATATETAFEAESADKILTSTEAGDIVSGKKQGLLGMYVTIQNKAGGTVVPRLDLSKYPDHKAPQWDLKYSIAELSDQGAERILSLLKRRRQKAYFSSPELKTQAWHRMFDGGLARTVDESKAWRGAQDSQDANKPVRVAWANDPLAVNKG
ncbi:mitochondrial protein Pet127-domain-containing protein [Thelonectria olida]|uniref:Mitochondrial protein Pet127-domain-containing protein n=1 Tax=Thelonectria olida TaxID=1576542 RepID=A0A9P9AS49_9HYPO|nr:mitochondrial protein Pet127-domain-containing protein [Thelonectria olida]